MFQEIIVALDGSEYSLKGLDHARELAEKHGGRLVLLHAYQYTSDLLGSEEHGKLVGRRKAAGKRSSRRPASAWAASPSRSKKTCWRDRPPRRSYRPPRCAAPTWW